MNKILFVLLASSWLVICNAQPLSAGNLNRMDTQELIQFEKEIGYFYGAPNPELIKTHYVDALQALERMGADAGDANLAEHMLPELHKAYAEVASQTHLQFDVDQAAKLEFMLIIAHAKQASFEEINQIMLALYKVVFNSESFNIKKAAMLRTFLYQYKATLLQNENVLLNHDKELLLAIAKSSEIELQKI